MMMETECNPNPMAQKFIEKNDEESDSDVFRTVVEKLRSVGIKN
jgi:hypothetical protein